MHLHECKDVYVCVHVHVCMHTPAPVCICYIELMSSWQSENSLWESVLSLHQVWDPGLQAWWHKPFLAESSCQPLLYRFVFANLFY